MEFDFFSLLLVFIVLSSLQPVIAQRLLQRQRFGKIREFEEKRNSRVILMIHHQETVSFLGIPISRYIDIRDSEQVLRAIKLTDDDVPIDFIIHTPGGLVLAAEQIAMALKKHPAKVTVFVPHYAMSGGTMVALAADEIVMDENAVLGPVDPQIGQQPAASILTVIEQKPVAEIDDRTLILADVARKALGQVKQTVMEILDGKMAPDETERIAELLSSGTWTHDYPIMVHEARQLGLTVSCDMPQEVYELMDLYPQPRQNRPSVQYIPTPYGEPEEKRTTRRENL